jgi:hypothetical protein
VARERDLVVDEEPLGGHARALDGCARQIKKRRLDLPSSSLVEPRLDWLLNQVEQLLRLRTQDIFNLGNETELVGVSS